MNRLGHDLEQVDEPGGGGGASTTRSSMPGRYSRMRKYLLGFKGERDKGVKHGGTNDLCITILIVCIDKRSIYAEDDDILDDAALYEPPIKQPRKRKERDENENEPLYCYCRQVSYGEMVACDGEVGPFFLSLVVVEQTCHRYF